MTEEQVLARLREAVRKAGSQAAWAALAGVSQPFVNDVLAGRRGLTKAILDALGIERVVTYRLRK